MGSIDETRRRFKPAERRIAELLAEEGATVTALPEDPTGGKAPDALVGGVTVEFKTVRTGASSATVNRALGRSVGQARHVILDARGSGLSAAEARRGVRRFVGTPYGQRLEGIRIIGDGFDNRWPRQRYWLQAGDWE